MSSLLSFFLSFFNEIPGVQFGLDIIQEHLQDNDYHQIMYHMLKINDDEAD